GGGERERKPNQTKPQHNIPHWLREEEGANYLLSNESANLFENLNHHLKIYGQSWNPPSSLGPLPSPTPCEMGVHNESCILPALITSNPSDGHTAPRIGLNLGVRTYFSAEDTAVGRLAKRPCAGPPNTQVPMCQAEGCKADLSTAKHYHRRHKVCELHSKAPTVIAAGLTKRFCQQCSRFHLLAEFDEGKRSCRKRLADHNRRRRKPQPGQSGPHLSLSSLGGQLGLSQQQASCQSRQATGNYNTSTRIEPGVPWLRPLNSRSDLMQQQEVVVGRSPPSLQQQQQHFQPPHHSTTLASANSPRSQNQKLQVYSPSNQNLIPMQSFSRGDLGSPEWMLGSRDERSKQYGPSSSAMSGSHIQLQQQGHQMLGLLDNTSTIHHHQAGDDSGLVPGGGGGGGTGQCGSSAAAAAAGGHAAPAMEFLQHGIIHPTTTESNVTPDNNNNNNNDEKNKKEKSPELKVYSHELEALRSYEAGSSIYDSHPLL
ncbi:unnamed protein product, partial [Sphagnum compactum]